MPVVQLHSTNRFSVLSAHYAWQLKNQDLASDGLDITKNNDSSRRFPPILALEDLLWHESKHATPTVNAQLKDALCKYGYILISVHNKQAVRVIRDLRESLHRDLFPSRCDQGAVLSSSNERIGIHNAATTLATSPVTYVSEKGVPMYKLGYELCADGVRQVFRMAGGAPDSVEYPPLSLLPLPSLPLQRDDRDSANNNDTIYPSDTTSRTIWLRGLGFLRHVTDTALDVLLWSETTCSVDKMSRTIHVSKRRSVLPWWQNQEPDTENGDSHRRRRRGGGIPDSPIPERAGDFSVLYAMHYFNKTSTATMLDSCSDDNAVVEQEQQPRVAVHAHVDPSLLVLEPFLCPTTRGLQVWDRIDGTWLDCDGPDSLLGQYIRHCTAAPSLSSWNDPCKETEPAEVMLLFSGKGLVNALAAIEPSDSMTSAFAPTLHRVVMGDEPRRTVIYEQKYAEFYPPPSFD
jgi:hypothetical protein